MARRNADSTTSDDQAREEVGVAGVAQNRDLEHVAGDMTTRDDPMDAGVPMVQGSPDEPVGPEDAFGPGPKRGDYSGRVITGPPMVTEVIPEDERQSIAEGLAKPDDGLSVAAALGDVPRTRLVPALERAGEVGDSEGKGGVSTAEALEAARR